MTRDRAPNSISGNAAPVTIVTGEPSATSVPGTSGTSAPSQAVRANARRVSMQMYIALIVCCLN